MECTIEQVYKWSHSASVRSIYRVTLEVTPSQFVPWRGLPLLRQVQHLLAFLWTVGRAFLQLSVEPPSQK